MKRSYEYVESDGAVYRLTLRQMRAMARRVAKGRESTGDYLSRHKPICVIRPVLDWSAMDAQDWLAAHPDESRVKEPGGAP